MRKQNHWKRNQKIAVLAAGSLLAQCVGVGIPVRAEIKHVEVSEGMTWERATASDASVLPDDGARIDGEKATLEKATPAQAERIASISLLASPGNLWENWPETMDFPGDESLFCNWGRAGQTVSCRSESDDSETCAGAD